MASKRAHGNKIRVEWRFGGTRQGKSLNATFEDEELADEAIQLLVDAKHLLTREDLYKLMLGEVESVDKISHAPRVRDMVDDFIASRPRRAPRTNQAYRSHFMNEILPAFGDMPVDTVTRNHVARFIKHLDETKKTSGTVTRHYSTLHAFFAFVESEVPSVIRSPVNTRQLGFVRDGIRHNDITDEAAEKRMYLTYDEFDRISVNVRSHSKALVELLVNSGTRISEAVALDVQDLNIQSREIRVFKQTQHDPEEKDPDKAWKLVATKGREKRRLTLDEGTFELLIEKIDGRKPGTVPGSAPIFLSPQGKRWDYNNFLDRDWYPAIAAAMRCADHMPPLPPKPQRGPRRGYRVDEVSECACSLRLHRRPTPHQLRHTHATWLLDQGYTIEQVSRRLGHKNVRITDETYSDFTREKDHAMALSLGEARQAARARRNQV